MTFEDENSQGGRLRIVLLIVIAMLLFGLGLLGFYFVKALQPIGVATDAEEQVGLTWVRSMYGFGPAADEQLLSPNSVAIAPNGDVYANDPQRSRIMRFSADGSFKQLIHTGAGGMGPGQFRTPGAMAVDDKGNLYVCDVAANKIIVFNPSGKFLREWQSPQPRGIDVEGTVAYVLGEGSVTAYSTSGALAGSFGKRGRAASDIDAYQGIVSDGTRVYIADALNGQVKAFDRSGKLVWVNPETRATPASSGGSHEASAGAFSLPQDLAFDGAGHLVVVDAFNFDLVVMDAQTGRVEKTLGDFGTDEGKFLYPSGIAYDKNRDWFIIADTRNNRIQIVRLPGSGSTQKATVGRALTSPYRYCALPLLLALVALLVALITRPRRVAVKEGR